MDNPALRQPGAQPGNANALKHGFYSRFFNSPEMSDLDNVQALSLVDEITMLRVAMRRVLERYNEADTLAERLTLLRGLSMGSTALARAVRIRNHNPSVKEGVEDAMAGILEAMCRPLPDGEEEIPSRPKQDPSEFHFG